MLKTVRFSRCLLSRTSRRQTVVAYNSSAETVPRTLDDDDDDMPVEMENPFKPQTKRCFLCGVHVDYKNVQLLSQFISSYTGVTLSQKLTGLCDKKYKEVVKKIDLARRSHFLAYRTKETTFLNDPDITNSGPKRSARVSLNTSEREEDYEGGDSTDVAKDMEFVDVDDGSVGPGKSRRHFFWERRGDAAAKKFTKESEAELPE